MKIVTGLVAGLVLGACFIPVQLDIEIERSSVRIEMPYFSDYSSAVSRLRLSEARSGATLWEVRSLGSPSFDIFRLELEVGDNPASLLSQDKWARYRIVVPRNRSSFVLQRGVDYRFEVWNKSGWRKTSGTFRFPT